MTKNYLDPDDWENAMGDTVDRTREVGLAGRRLRGKLGLTSTVTKDQTIVDHKIQQLGQHTQKLISLSPNSSVYDEKHEYDDDSSQLSIVADDDDDADQEMEDLILDNEYNTQHWTFDKLQSALETLVMEIEQSEDAQRRSLACRMLCRVLINHPDAKWELEQDLEHLLPRCFGNLRRWTPVQKRISFHLTELLAAIASIVRGKLSREKVVLKCLTMLSCDVEAGARIVQHHWRHVLAKRRGSHESALTLHRAQVLYDIKMIELKEQFRTLRRIFPECQKGGIWNWKYTEEGGSDAELDQVLEAHLRIIRTMTDTEDSSLSKSVKRDRLKFLRHGGMVILKDGLASTKSALKQQALGIYLNLSEEPMGIEEILACNVMDDLVCGIHVDSTIIEEDTFRRLQAIENIAWHAIERTEQEWKELIGKPTGTLATTSVTSQRSSHLLSQSRSEVQENPPHRTIIDVEVVQQNLATPDLLSLLMEILALPVTSNSSRQRLIFCACRIIHHLTCTSGYFLLLDRFVQLSGVALEHLVGLLSHHQTEFDLAHAALRVFDKLTVKPEGRQGLITAGVGKILMPLSQGGVLLSGNRVGVVRGLTVLCYLARQTLSRRQLGLNSQQLQPQPHRRHHRQSCGEDVAELYEFFASELLSVASATCFVTLEALPVLIDFVLHFTKDNTATVQHWRFRSISARLLAVFTSVPTVARAWCQDPVLSYLSQILNQNQIDESERRTFVTDDVETAAEFHAGTSGACEALIHLGQVQLERRDPDQVAENDVENDKIHIRVSKPETVPSNIFVAQTLLHLRVQDELLYHLTSARDGMLSDAAQARAQATVASVFLTLAPTSRDDDSDMYLQPSTLDNIQLETQINTILEQWCLDTLGALVSLLACDTLESVVVQSACGALAQYCTLNRNCASVIASGAIPIVAQLVPLLSSAPTKSSLDQKKSVKLSAEEWTLCQVPASVFCFFAKLARVPEGREALIRANVLPRVLRRLLCFCSSSKQEQECQIELAMIMSYMANVNTSRSENLNEWFMSLDLPRCLLRLLQSQLEPLVVTKMKSQSNIRLLVAVLRALDMLGQDVMVTIPHLVSLGILPTLYRLLRHCTEHLHDALGRVQCLLTIARHTLSLLRHIVSYPDGEYHAPFRAEKGYLVYLSRLVKDFKLEKWCRNQLRGHKSVGELAQETIESLKTRVRYQQELKKHIKSRESLTPERTPMVFPPTPEFEHAYVGRSSQYIYIYIYCRGEYSRNMF